MEIKDFAELVVQIKSFGLLAPIVAFLIFVIQAILPIIPYLLIAGAGGMIFGFAQGFLIAWLGALLGACIFYWLCRYLGYRRFKQYIELRFNIKLRKIPPETAFWTLLIARIVPVVPTLLINASAALGGVSFWNFFFSSAIGKIPTAVLYTGIGLCLFKTQDVNLILALIAAVLCLTLLAKHFVQNKSFSI